MAGVRPRNEAVRLGTAMEPTEEQPDDGGMPVQTTPPAIPQWSRPKAGRTTGGGKHRRPADHHAAMEPTENRPDDAEVYPCAADKEQALQWGRPENPPDDVDTVITTTGNQLPQWSRPRTGRTTDHDQRRAGVGDRAAMKPAVPRPDDSRQLLGVQDHAAAAMEPTAVRPDALAFIAPPIGAHMPQWSRPRNGRMTRLAGPIRRRHGRAAMGQPRDRMTSSTSATSRRTTHRNGADQGPAR
jgi:hypothetical protein